MKKTISVTVDISTYVEFITCVGPREISPTINRLMGEYIEVFKTREDEIDRTNKEQMSKEIDKMVTKAALMKKELAKIEEKEKGDRIIFRSSTE